MQRHRFYLELSSEQVKDFYSGRKRYVQCQTMQGKSLRFDAQRLKPFVDHEGVHGEFMFIEDKAKTWRLVRV